MNVISSARPAVSVVMCVHQPVPAFLREAVMSVRRQSLDDWELIIVEDPSSVSGHDALCGVLDQRIRHYVNGGRTSLVDQRNRALLEARADFVALLDCDDIAEPERLERQLEFLHEHRDIVLLGSQVSVINHAGSTVGYRRFPETHAEVLRAMPNIVPFCHPSVMFRKSVVIRAGGYQDTFGPLVDDYDLYSRLALAGARLGNHPRALTRYRLHSAQTKARKLHETIQAVLRVKQRYWRDKMSRRQRWRMMAESCLLWLPQPLVLELVRRALYRDSPSSSLRAVGESTANGGQIAAVLYHNAGADFFDP